MDMPAEHSRNPAVISLSQAVHVLGWKGCMVAGASHPTLERPMPKRRNVARHDDYEHRGKRGNGTEPREVRDETFERLTTSRTSARSEGQDKHIAEDNLMQKRSRQCSSRIVVGAIRKKGTRHLKLNDYI